MVSICFIANNVGLTCHRLEMQLKKLGIFPSHIVILTGSGFDKLATALRPYFQNPPVNLSCLQLPIACPLV